MTCCTTNTHSGIVLMFLPVLPDKCNKNNNICNIITHQMKHSFYSYYSITNIYRVDFIHYVSEVTREFMEMRTGKKFDLYILMFWRRSQRWKTVVRLFVWVSRTPDHYVVIITQMSLTKSNSFRQCSKSHKYSLSMLMALSCIFFFSFDHFTNDITRSKQSFLKTLCTDLSCTWFCNYLRAFPMLI